MVIFVRLLLLLLAIVPLWGNAARIVVTPSNYATQISSFQEGDTLVFVDGIYSENIELQNQKTLVLVAAESATPFFTGVIRPTDGSLNDVGLVMEGFKINPEDNYFFSGNWGAMNILKFTDCEITGVGRCLLRSDITEISYIDSIVIESCVISGCGTNGYNFIYPKHVVRNIRVENSTLYNYINGESLFFPNSTDTSNEFSFLFKNNTVYKWAKSSDRALCNVASKYAPTSSFTFLGNIIYKPGVDGQTPKLLNASTGILKAENNLIVDYDGFYGGNFTETISDLTLDNLGLTALGFPDPDNGNFSISSTSPLATAGKDGGPIGDPRWIKYLSQAVTYSSSVAPGGAGSVSPKEGSYEADETVNITASRNYGYRFESWKDKNGVVIGTANPLALTLTQDTLITAAFSTVETYTLDVQVQGSDWGVVNFSPKPVNGVYETGTIVTLTVIPNEVSSFLYWEDKSSELSRQVLMDSDKSITANFAEKSFIVGWDFKQDGVRGDRPGDYYSETSNVGLMQLRNYDGSSTSWGGSNRTFGNVAYDCARRYTDFEFMESSPRYFLARFSATGYENIEVSSLVGYDNDCVHTRQLMQFSLDGKTFYDLLTVDVSGKKNTEWIPIKATLPDTLSDVQKSTLYIRWIPDLASSIVGPAGTGDTEGFYLANVFVYADEMIIDDSEAPQLIASVPAEGSSTASSNGKIVLTFNEKVKIGSGNVNLNGEVLAPTIANNTVVYDYYDLVYSADYSVRIPKGAITDLSGNDFEGVEINFRTMNRPTPVKRLFDAVIALDGSGDYTNLQDMVNAMPENRTAPWLVFVKKGTYYGLVRIPESKPYLHLIGQDKDSVTITFTINCSSGPTDSGWEFTKSNFGVSDCATIVIQSSNFYAENISFENGYGVKYQKGPQALALATKNDRFAFHNVKMRSFQDTWQTSALNGNNHRFYIGDSWIEGAVDYIYGGGNLYAENCTFYNVRSGSVIVAPNHTTDTRWGYVFESCRVDGNTAAADGRLKLGRPWHNNPITVYLNTTMAVPIHPEGWTDMGCYPGLFAEYNSMDSAGNLIDVSSRRTWYTVDGVRLDGFQSRLSPGEAAKYTYDNVLSGTDRWNPRQIFENAGSPQNVTINGLGQLNWDDNDYAICFVIYRDDEVVGFSKESHFNDLEYMAAANFKYAVRAVNEYGSLSEPSAAKADLSTGSYDPLNSGQEALIAYKNQGHIVVEGTKAGDSIKVYAIDGRLVYQSFATDLTTMIRKTLKKAPYLITVGQRKTKIIN